MSRLTWRKRPDRPVVAPRLPPRTSARPAARRFSPTAPTCRDSPRAEAAAAAGRRPDRHRTLAPHRPGPPLRLRTARPRRPAGTCWSPAARWPSRLRMPTSGRRAARRSVWPGRRACARCPRHAPGRRRAGHRALPADPRRAAGRSAASWSPPCATSGCCPSPARRRRGSRRRTFGRTASSAARTAREVTARAHDLPAAHPARRPAGPLALRRLAGAARRRAGRPGGVAGRGDLDRAPRRPRAGAGRRRDRGRAAAGGPGRRAGPGGVRRGAGRPVRLRVQGRALRPRRGAAGDRRRRRRPGLRQHRGDRRLVRDPARRRPDRR